MSRARKILERLSSVVYHITPRKALLNILGNDTFTLSGNDVGDRQGHHKEAPYSISFSRSINSSYMSLGKVSDTRLTHFALLVIDGDRLNQRYSGHAVNYFAGNGGRSMGTSEMEDRLFSKEKYLPNFSRYIKEVHVLGFPENALKKAVSNRGLPLYVHENISSFKALKRGNRYKVYHNGSITTNKGVRVPVGAGV